MPNDEPSDDAIDNGVDPETARSYTGFEREVALVRSLAEDPVEWVDAPDQTWAAIAGAMEPSGDTEQVEIAEPVEITAPRRSRRRMVIAAVAAAAVVVLVGAVVLVRLDDGGSSTSLASADLAPYQGADVGAATASVKVVRDGDQQRLRVEMHDLPAPAPGTFYELWLIDPASGAPVSVATMKDGASDVTTDVDLPPGTDPARNDIVDVSVQQDSEGPDHSGNSILRGTLS